MAFRSEVNRHSFLKTINLVRNHHDPDKIVFFVTGNPGMIRYYHEFLALLADNLAFQNAARFPADSHPESYIIYGTSLAGFGGENIERFGDSAEEHHFRPRSGEGNEYYDLQEQIDFVEGNLRSLVKQWKANQKDPTRKPEVIIIGHSVGGYIAMELLRRHRERENPNMNIIGEILLFPTVVDIAKSPSGVKFSVRLIFRQVRRPFSHSLNVTWRLLTIKVVLKLYPLPGNMGKYTSEMPCCNCSGALAQAARARCNEVPPSKGGRCDDGSAAAQDSNLSNDLRNITKTATVSRYLAGFEMKEIQSDRWEDDIWAISPHATDSDQNKASNHRMIFYFGRDDHWIANSTRDKLIRVKEEQKAKLGADSERLRFVVCENKVAHGFCIHRDSFEFSPLTVAGHSDIMAHKVATFVKEISQPYPVHTDELVQNAGVHQPAMSL
ncbi:hypothetical protein KEM54_000746 [Ascosphaera aggregata]|nr:hypothetical protein KEM54_000746 [Ascosphaera aggregata]